MGLFGNQKKKEREMIATATKNAKRVVVRCPKCGKMKSALFLSDMDTIPCNCGYTLSPRDRS